MTQQTFTLLFYGRMLITISKVNKTSYQQGNQESNPGFHIILQHK